MGTCIETSVFGFRIVGETFLELCLLNLVYSTNSLVGSYLSNTNYNIFFTRRASAALNCLKRFHEMKKRGPKPYSLHLDHIIQKAISTHQKRDQYRVQKDIVILKVLLLLIFQNLI